MRRRLFNALTLLSLLLCAAVCALWVRSYWIGDRWACHKLSRHQDTTRADYYTEEEYLAGRAIEQYRVGSDRGVVWAEHETGWETFDQWCPPQFWTDYPQFAPLAETTVLRRLGFGYAGGPVWSDEPWLVMVPHAALAATFAAPPGGLARPPSSATRACPPLRPWALPRLRLRPARHPRPLPGVRDGGGGETHRIRRLEWRQCAAVYSTP